MNFLFRPLSHLSRSLRCAALALRRFTRPGLALAGAAVMTAMLGLIRKTPSAIRPLRYYPRCCSWRFCSAFLKFVLPPSDCRRAAARSESHSIIA